MSLNLTGLAAGAPVRLKILADGGVVFEHVEAERVEPRVFLDSAGDVLSAREAARALLGESFATGADATLAVLVLTASFLHLDASGRGGVHPRGVIDCLNRIGELGPEGAGFHTSPMQFVRYVAVELDTTPVEERLALMRTLLTMVQTRSAPLDQK